MKMSEQEYTKDPFNMFYVVSMIEDDLYKDETALIAVEYKAETANGTNAYYNGGVEMLKDNIAKKKELIKQYTPKG